MIVQSMDASKFFFFFRFCSFCIFLFFVFCFFDILNTTKPSSNENPGCLGKGTFLLNRFLYGMPLDLLDPNACSKEDFDLFVFGAKKEVGSQETEDFYDSDPEKDGEYIPSESDDSDDSQFSDNEEQGE